MNVHVVLSVVLNELPVVAVAVNALLPVAVPDACHTKVVPVTAEEIPEAIPVGVTAPKFAGAGDWLKA